MMLQAIITSLVGVVSTYEVRRLGILGLGREFGSCVMLVRGNGYCRYLISPAREVQVLGQQALFDSRSQRAMVGDIDLAAYVAGGFKGLSAEVAERLDLSLGEVATEVLRAFDLGVLMVERMSLITASLQNADRAYAFMMRRRLTGCCEYLTGVYTLPADLFHQGSQYCCSPWRENNIDSINALVQLTGEKPELRGAGSAGMTPSLLRSRLTQGFKGITCHDGVVP